MFNPYITVARSHAVDYYLQSDNLEKLAEGYYELEDFDKLKGLLDSVPDNHTLLEVRAGSGHSDNLVCTGLVFIVCLSFSPPSLSPPSLSLLSLSLLSLSLSSLSLLPLSLLSLFLPLSLLPLSSLSLFLPPSLLPLSPPSLSPFLKTMADQFVSVGMAESAVKAYIKVHVLYWWPWLQLRTIMI